MLPIILFPTIYNLAVSSLSTLNPSEQFSICSTMVPGSCRATEINKYKGWRLFSYRPYKAFLVPGSCRATERNKYNGWRLFSYRPYKVFLVPGSCRATERNKYNGWRLFSYRPYKAFLVPGSCRATERNKYKGWRFGSCFFLYFLILVLQDKHNIRTYDKINLYLLRNRQEKRTKDPLFYLFL